MKKSLPSLNAIRFFECAARHLSFTRAAEELFVTQGAVSKQIKLLEEQLDCQLFARKGPQLALTKQGEKLLDSVASALGIIKLGVSNLRRATDSTITVSILPSFGSQWLLPRLSDFEARHPDIGIRLASSYANIDFSINTDIDVGIRLGRGKWIGLYAKKLTTDRMFPVCSPELAKNIKSIADLNQHRLLVDNHPYDEWGKWFAAVGESFDSCNTRHYDDTGAQIYGAIDGHGISLLREELIQEYLKSGVLVRLFDVEYISSIHYYFVCPESRVDEFKIACFRDWLMQVN